MRKTSVHPVTGLRFFFAGPPHVVLDWFLFGFGLKGPAWASACMHGGRNIFGYKVGSVHDCFQALCGCVCVFFSLIMHVVIRDTLRAGY